MLGAEGVAPPSLHIAKWQLKDIHRDKLYACENRRERYNYSKKLGVDYSDIAIRIGGGILQLVPRIYYNILHPNC